MKLFKLKPHSIQTLRNWGIQVSTTRKKEAQESLREENCSHEVLKVFEINGDYYAIGYMEGENILSASDSTINTEHKKVLKECLGEEIPLEIIYNLHA